MGELTVDDQTLTYEQIAESAADRSVAIEIEYSRRYVDGSERERIELDADRRGDVTKDLIEATLADWHEERGNVVVETYEVLEEVECRRGELVEVDHGRSRSTEVPEDKPEPGVDARVLEEGQVVAYYVGGPGHDIYGYVSEGVVEALPPWSRSPGDNGDAVTDAVRMDVGGRSKEIPLAWIVGPVDSEEVADAVDRPREALR